MWTGFVAVTFPGTAQNILLVVQLSEVLHQQADSRLAVHVDIRKIRDLTWRGTPGYHKRMVPLLEEGNTWIVAPGSRQDDFRWAAVDPKYRPAQISQSSSGFSRRNGAHLFPLRLIPNTIDGAPQMSSMVPILDRTPEISCPVLGLFGNDDQFPTPQQVDDIEKALIEAGKDYEFHRYDGAGHGFFYYDRAAYRQEQAMDGWKKLFAFTDRTLR